MRDNKPNKFHLLEAALNDDTVIAEWALLSGVHVNSVDQFGQTALHKAALKDSMRIAKLLLTLPQTSLNKTDCGGNTALDLAEEYGRKRIVRMIKDEGCKRDMILDAGPKRWNVLIPNRRLG